MKPLETKPICCFHSHKNLLIAYCQDGTLWARPIGQSTDFGVNDWLQIAGIPDQCEECGGTSSTGHQNLCSWTEDEDEEEDWEMSFRDLQDRVKRFVLEIDEVSEGDFRGVIQKHQFNQFLKGKR